MKRRRTSRTPAGSRQQRAIIALLARGLSNKEIGEQIGIGEGTVKFYLVRIYRDLHIGATGNNRVQLALYALRNQYE